MKNWQVNVFGFALLCTLSFGFFTQSRAQTDAPQLRVLVAGVDVNGQGFPISLVALNDGTAQTLATFANRPICVPAVFSDGQALFYELQDASGQPFVYRIDIVNRTRELVLEPTPEVVLSCPVVGADGQRVAWIRRNPDMSMTLVVTSSALTNPQDVITHEAIYDVQWSPGGAAIVYHVNDAVSGFPTLYSIPAQGGPNPRTVFSPADGLLQSYRWTADSTGLIVTYYTDELLAMAVLPAACVIGPGEECTVTPVATFPFEAAVTLTGAYSSDNRATIIVLQSMTVDGFTTDLYRVDLDETSTPQQLTVTPNLVENDVYWSENEGQLYFTGSRFDEASQIIRGAIYRLALDVADAEPEIVFESEVFSPAQFLWWYED